MTLDCLAPGPGEIAVISIDRMTTPPPLRATGRMVTKLSLLDFACSWSGWHCCTSDNRGGNRHLCIRTVCLEQHGNPWLRPQLVDSKCQVVVRPPPPHACQSGGDVVHTCTPTVLKARASTDACTPYATKDARHVHHTALIRRTCKRRHSQWLLVVFVCHVAAFP